MLYDNQKAKDTYEELQKLYPNSPYSKKASIKIAALQQAEKRKKAEAEKRTAAENPNTDTVKYKTKSGLPKGFVEQGKALQKTKPASGKGAPPHLQTKKIPPDSTLNRRKKRF